MLTVELLVPEPVLGFIAKGNPPILISPLPTEVKDAWIAFKAAQEAELGG